MIKWPESPSWDEEFKKQQKDFIQQIQIASKEAFVTPEAKVKAKVKQVLANVNAYYIMPNTSGFGSSGAPDFVVCLRGKFIGIECKGGANKTSRLQDKNLREIMNHGGVSMVVDESTNMTEFQLKLIYLMEND